MWQLDWPVPVLPGLASPGAALLPKQCTFWGAVFEEKGLKLGSSSGQLSEYLLASSVPGSRDRMILGNSLNTPAD